MNIDKVRERMAAKSHDHATLPMPDTLKNIAESAVVDLDVRADLRRGVEPFSRIMQVQSTLPEGAVLRLRAIFDPVPLYTVLGKQGFSAWTEKLADDDWRVWFYRAGHVQPTAAAAQAPKAVAPDVDDEFVIVDVRGLEPPEPMTITLEALAQLPPGKQLLQINVRVPQLLLPMLAERGFEYLLVSEQPNEVRGVIRRITTHTEETRPMSEKQLDVRVIPPREKHPAIFATFDALDPDTSFVLINDHDPFPLRYQFQAERAGTFTWDYVEQGPVVWRVRIGKVAAACASR